MTNSKGKFSIENPKKKLPIKNRSSFRIDKMTNRILRKKAYLLEHLNNLTKDSNLQETYFRKDFQV